MFGCGVGEPGLILATSQDGLYHVGQDLILK